MKKGSKFRNKKEVKSIKMHKEKEVQSDSA
jgi:hypothetical protein